MTRCLSPPFVAGLVLLACPTPMGPVETARRDFGDCAEPIALAKNEIIQSEPDMTNPSATWVLRRFEFDTGCSPIGWVPSYDHGDYSVLYQLGYCSPYVWCQYFVLAERLVDPRIEDIRFYQRQAPIYPGSGPSPQIPAPPVGCAGLLYTSMGYPTQPYSFIRGSPDFVISVGVNVCCAGEPSCVEPFDR